MIDRLVPKYRLFLILGFVIMGVSLFMLTAGRDVAIAVWVTKLLDGDTGSGFEAAQIADKVIGHLLTTLLFVGLSFIKLGIGFAIVTIVRNLRATGRRTLENYGSAGVIEADKYAFQQPWFSRYFRGFLVTGMAIVLFFFVIGIWWEINVILLKQAEFAGETGTAFHAYTVIERVLDPLIASGKFIGEAVLIVGIALGLATIVTNLSFQARALPFFTRRAMGAGEEPSEPLKPKVPWTLASIAMGGAAIMIAAFPVAVVRAASIGWSLDRQFDGQFAPGAVRLDGVLARIVDPTIAVGLGILFFAIALLLLNIGWLREQRRGFGAAVADTTGSDRPYVEESVWPQRLVAPLAVFGLVVTLFFFFSMTAVRTFNFDALLTLRAAADTGPVVLQNAERLDAMLKPIIAATRFLGVGALMLAIGLALVTIVIQLRATAMMLPGGFAKLLGRLQGEDPDDDDDIEILEPMQLAPWELMRPHLLGMVFIVTATLPIIVLEAISINNLFTEQFAGRGPGEMMSGLYESSLLSFRLYDASFGPWMMFGMGLVLFAIGRFFSTIVGFVQARMMIIGEGTQAIAMEVSDGSDDS